MMKCKSIGLILLFGCSLISQAQYTKEYKRIFFDADYLYETGFYEEAFNRYKNLLTLDPGNSNILFHCGVCCLNMPGSEGEAVHYLKEAVKGVSTTYKDKSHKEAGAPVLTYFMLGRAYHLQYEFDEARVNYRKYLELAEKADPLQLAYTEQQIEACNRASSVELDRPDFEFRGVLDHFDEQLPSCSNPVVSGDGKILIFLVDYPSDKKIMMSEQGEDSLWSRPRVINSEIGMVGETYPVSMSYDGKELYLAHEYYSHSDIFISRLKGKRWTEAQALGYHINGRTSEEHASISRDGNTLYFTSDIRGGEGSFDIYRSEKDEDGDWGPPENLGPVINTPFEEKTPFISSNDSILFFSSQGHASMGGLDVFFSQLRTNGSWTSPESLGYPVNTTDDDLFFNPGWGELEGYYAVRREDDPTTNTIRMVMELEYEEEDVAEQEVAEEEIQAFEEPGEIRQDPVQELPVQEEAMERAQNPITEPPHTDDIEEVLNQGFEPEPEVREERASGTSDSPPYFTEIWTRLPFDVNAFHLNLEARLEGQRIAELIMSHPGLTIEITGHADDTGPEEYNMLLSLQRAEAVATFLEDQGVDRRQIRLMGKGEHEPIARLESSDKEELEMGRYLNRQVIVRISGNLPLDPRLRGVYVPEHLKYVKAPSSNQTNSYHFTIQLKASFIPLPAEEFQDLQSVKEFICTDGYYRYIWGDFNDFSEARRHLQVKQSEGFADAFIQTRAYYDRAEIKSE